MIATTNFAIERMNLDNGLRIVLNPDPSAPVVGVTVVYDVGIRAEPRGRAGFAHLFEHLMFQGSANLEKLSHFRYVQGAGGTFNGSTHLDYTDYVQVVPSNALERTLFLEADRMRALKIGEENLANQVDVVKEEIRTNILNRPYGGFPWLRLPSVLFDDFANAHDGYGSFDDLDAATVDDAFEFFQRHYSCGNAVLSIVGDLDVDLARTYVERHFGDLVPRSNPPSPSVHEPGSTGDKCLSYVDRLAPAPAVAAAWPVPDPVDSFAAYLAFVLLAEVLTDGEASRLVDRLVLNDRLATSVGGFVGLMGDPLDVRHPTALVLQAYLTPDGVPRAALDAMDEEIERVLIQGVGHSELSRVTSRLVANMIRGTDPVIGRGVRMGVFELQRNEPELLNRIWALISAVTPGQVAEAAGELRANRRAVVIAEPGGGR